MNQALLSKGRLLALLVNIRLEWMWQPKTNALAYKQIFNETARFNKCKHLFENQNLLLLRDICWLKLLFIFKFCSFFSTPMLIRLLWQLKTVVLLHWCLIHAGLLTLSRAFVAVILCHRNVAF